MLTFWARLGQSSTNTPDSVTLVFSWQIKPRLSP